jgi:hypothetical protein
MRFGDLPLTWGTLGFTRPKLLLSNGGCCHHLIIFLRSCIPPLLLMFTLLPFYYSNLCAPFFCSCLFYFSLIILMYLCLKQFIVYLGSLNVRLYMLHVLKTKLWKWILCSCFVIVGTLMYYVLHEID